MLTAGRATIARVVDLDPFALPLAGIFPGAAIADLEAAAAVLADRHVDYAAGNVLLAVQSHLVRFAGRTILIDTCVGEHKARPLRPEWNERAETRYLANLASAGCAPEDVDIVMCTHLHADHVGWNTRLQSGAWVPTFRNARYVATRRDIDQRAADAAKSPQANHGSYQDSVPPILEAGLFQTMQPGDELAEGATIVDLKGHSPGQIGLDIAVERRLACAVLRRRDPQPGAGILSGMVQRLLLRQGRGGAHAADAAATGGQRRPACSFPRTCAPPACGLPKAGRLCSRH